jgi:hypothetical protein
VGDCHISINGLPRLCPKADRHDRLLVADSTGSMNVSREDVGILNGSFPVVGANARASREQANSAE